MVIDVVENIEYRDIMQGQIYEVIEFLVSNSEEFSLTANIKGASFNPEMPEPIAKNFPPFTLFSLMNFTFESIVLTETYISFEAGFGAENFGSVVTIPLYAIFQIIIDESILLLNPTATVEKFFIKEDTNQQERSMNAFKMNTKNKNLL